MATSFGNSGRSGPQKSRPGALARQPNQTGKGPTRTPANQGRRPGGCATCGGHKKIFG